MRRKRLTAVLAAVLAFSLAACGGSAASAASDEEAAVSSGGDYDLRLVNGKEGIAQNALGVVYQDFALGELDTEGFIRAVTQVCYQYYNW